MALRSVLEIDVNDDKFKAFRESFEKYRTAVDNLPGAWKAVGTSAQATSNVFRDIAALTLAQSERIAMSVQQTQTLNRHLGVTHRQMGLIERTARSFGQHIADATRHIFSWRTALGLTGFAALDLFGISRLAQSASGGFRTATGLGTTWGGMSGFNVGFGQLLQSPQSMLGNIQQGKIDPTSDQRRALAALGFTPAQIAQMDPATLAGEAAVRMGAWARRQRPESLGTMAQVSGMTSLAPIGDIINLRDRPEEAAAARERARQAAEENRLTTGQLKRWAALNQSLDAAKQRIETALIVGLGNVTPGLEKLITTFSKAVAAFLKSDTVAEWMDKLSEGLKSFAAYMQTDDFKRGVENVVATLAAFGRAVWKAVEWIAHALGETTGGEMGSIPPSYRQHGDPFGFGPAGHGHQHSPFGNWIERWHDYFFGKDRASTKTFGFAGEPEKVGFLDVLAKREQGEAGYYSLYKGGDFTQLPVDATGFPQWRGRMGPQGMSRAAGRYQFEPGTWAAEAKLLGLTNFWDPVQQDRAAWDNAARTYFQQKGRDLASDLRAGGHEADISEALHGQWPSTGPGFIADLKNVLGRLAGSKPPVQSGEATPQQRGGSGRHHRQAANPTVRVVIDNRTGASIATLANMATASL